MTRQATPEDVDDLCRSLPEVELARDELAEIILDAWAARAPEALVRKHLGGG